MIRELDDIIFFDNDDEFYNFVLVPVVKVSVDNTGDQQRSINELTTNCRKFINMVAYHIEL